MTKNCPIHKIDTSTEIRVSPHCEVCSSDRAHQVGEHVMTCLQHIRTCEQCNLVVYQHRHNRCVVCLKFLKTEEYYSIERDSDSYFDPVHLATGFAVCKDCANNLGLLINDKRIAMASDEIKEAIQVLKERMVMVYGKKEDQK